MSKISRLFLVLCSWVILAGNAFAVAPENGWWWNPTESGSGYAIERQGNSIFMAAFLYETSGAATWYATLLSLQPDGTYKGDMTRYVGGKSLLGPYKPATPTSVVATATASFPKPDSGTMTITFPNGSPNRTIPISRFAFASPSFEPSKGNFQSGWWWNDQESGTGYFIEVQGTSAFIASFMYETTGQPTWYASLSSLTDTNVLSGALDMYANGQALGGAYKAPTANAGGAGSMSYGFTTDSIGNMTLPNAAKVAIQRFVFDPTAITNHVPVPNAGSNQTVSVGDTVYLNGTGTDTDKDPLSFYWRLVTVPTGSKASLVDGQTTKPYFVADVAGTYRVLLLADDGKSSNGQSVVTVTANPKTSTNTPPVANAGANQTVAVGTAVKLTGAASSDANGDALTYAWFFVTRPSGSLASLTGATTVSPGFTADVAGNYVIGLNVNDGKASSAQSSVTVVATVAQSKSYAITANVNGLRNNKQLIVQNNSDNVEAINRTGPVYFLTPIIAGQSYSIKIITQPVDQMCTIENATGNNVNSNISNVNITCTDAISISGNITQDTTWKAGSSYYLDGNVGISQGITLKVEPGVTIYHDSGSLTIAGTFIAKGDANAHIYYTTLPIGIIGKDYSPSSRKYSRINFDNSVNSSIEYMDFENGVTIELNGISIVPFRNSKFINSSTAITDNQGYQYMSFINNTFSGNDIVFDGIRTSGGDFTNNNFNGNGKVFVSGIFFGNVNVNNNNFIQNTFVIDAPSIGYGYGTVDIRNNWWGTVDTVVIDKLINDGNDMVTLQKLNYLPILLSPNLSAGR